MRRVPHSIDRNYYKDNFVSSHTFNFISPLVTEQSGIPNHCTSCHTGKSTAWACKELRTWTNISPWRIDQ